MGHIPAIGGRLNRLTNRKPLGDKDNFHGASIASKALAGGGGAGEDGRRPCRTIGRRCR
jgi:hypothetical protein